MCREAKINIVYHFLNIVYQYGTSTDIKGYNMADRTVGARLDLLLG